MSELAAQGWSGIWKGDFAYNAALCLSHVQTERRSPLLDWICPLFQPHLEYEQC